MPTLIKSDPRAREKPCLRCGYSLRKIPDSKNCPECGLPIWISLSGHETFDLTNPDWIRKVRDATYILLGAQILAALYLFTSLLVGGRLSWILLVLPILYLLSYHAGLLLLTYPERRYPDRLAMPRLWARIAATAGLLLSCWVFNPGFFQWGFPPLISGLILIFSALATWPLLRKLLVRIPNPKLARCAGYVMLPPASTLLLLFPAVGFIILAEFPWILVVLAWVYVLGSTVLLYLAARAFHRCIPEAQTNWSSKG
jgi:hypothetical protein